jgi:hypothetical protein
VTPIEDQIRELEREVQLRRGHYRRSIDKGTLDEARANEQMARMDAALGTLRLVKALYDSPEHRAIKAQALRAHIGR